MRLRRQQKQSTLDQTSPATEAPAAARCRRRLALAYASAYLLIAMMSPALSALEPVGYAIAAALATLLIWTSMVDFREHRLPDGITLAILALALLRAGATGQQALVEALVSAAVGFAMLWLVAFTYRRLRQREGLGLGDVKLFGAAAAWVGLDGLASVLLLAALSALAGIALARALRADFDARGHIPFGPAIAIATWFVLWLGPVANALPH